MTYSSTAGLSSRADDAGRRLHRGRAALCDDVRIRGRRVGVGPVSPREPDSE